MWPVLGSFAMFTYLGGNRFMSYRRFKELVRSIMPEHYSGLEFDLHMPIKFEIVSFYVCTIMRCRCGFN